MPKYNYIQEDWALIKNCGHCGRIFYPILNEDFCNNFCEETDKFYCELYREDHESFLLDEW